MSGDEPAPEERAQRMAEEDDRRPRLLGGDQAIERPEVADNLVPPALVGEMAEIGGGTARPVPAMIVGISPVACGVEGGGDTRVAGAVLGEAMGDLHKSARATFGEPTPPQEGLTVVGAKRELASRHPRPSSWAPSLKRQFLTRNLTWASPGRQARWDAELASGIDKFTPRRIGLDRLGAESHGAVYFPHRRRGLLAWQGSGFSGFGRASAGARLYRPTAQARPLSQCRSGNDEPNPAWRGVRHRRRRRDGP